MYNSDCLESMFSHFLVSGNLSPWQQTVPDITRDISETATFMDSDTDF